METSHNSLGLRIVISAVIISIFIVVWSAYHTYSEDVKQNISQKMVELLPDMENGLAKL